EQRRLARAVGTDDHDNRFIQWQHDPLPVIPVHELQGQESKHSADLPVGLGCLLLLWRRCSLIEASREDPRQRPLDGARRQGAVIDESVQEGSFADLAAALMDKATPLEFAEVAMKANLAAEERPEIGL